jgi:hypothetical protein
VIGWPYYGDLTKLPAQLPTDPSRLPPPLWSCTPSSSIIAPQSLVVVGTIAAPDTILISGADRAAPDKLLIVVW